MKILCCLASCTCSSQVGPMQYLTSFLVHQAAIPNPWKNSTPANRSLSLHRLIMHECLFHAVTSTLSNGRAYECAITSWWRPGRSVHLTLLVASFWLEAAVMHQHQAKIVCWPCLGLILPSSSHLRLALSIINTMTTGSGEVSTTMTV